MLAVIRQALHLHDFAFGLVGGRFNLCMEAFKDALEKGIAVDVFAVHGFGVDDVAGEVGEDDAPGKGIFPGAGAQADVLALLGDPDAEEFEGRFVTDGGGGWVKILLGHAGVHLGKEIQVVRRLKDDVF